MKITVYDPSKDVSDISDTSEADAASNISEAQPVADVVSEASVTSVPTEASKASKAAETPPAEGETKPPESETPTVESAASPPGGETLPADPPAGFCAPRPAYVIAHELHLEELKDEFVCAAQQRSDLEADLKAAKLEEKNALKLYTQTLLRGPIKPADPKPTATTPGGQADSPEATPSDSPQAAEVAGVQSDAWRSASINELTDLSEKLREKLIEAGAETIGTLENLRAQIAEGKASWPKGVGAAKVTQIEDAVIAWLTRNRDSYAFQSAQQEQQAQQAGEGVATGDDIPADRPELTSQGEADEDWIDSQKWGMMPDGEKQAYLLARYWQLRGDDGNAEWALPAVEGANYFDDGEQEFWATVATGENHTLQTLLANAACPWHPCDAQDDWMRGFGAAYESWLAEKELPEGDEASVTAAVAPVAVPITPANTTATEVAAPANAPAWIDGF